MSKAFDIVVYGASGFTGRLCIRYLIGCSSASSTRVAAAGRSESKIRQVLLDLGAPDIPVLTADLQDEVALTALVKQTKCVITAAGPYTAHGSTLVRVCSENGVHCLDLTGEPTWSFEMKRLYEQTARLSKAILIHGSGYDSIPSDLNTYLAVKKLKSATSSPCGRVTGGFAITNGGFSGGTFATAIVLAEEIQDPEKRKFMMNNYCLSPIQGKHKSSGFYVHKEGKNRIGCFNFMGPVNTPVVYQTWGMLEEKSRSVPDSFNYGPDFEYREYMEVPNRFVAVLVSGTLFSLWTMLASSKMVRSLASKYGIQPGNGPSEQKQNSASFRVRTTARDVKNKVFARSTMTAKGDPGYLATSVMICESALGIVHDYDKLTDIAKEGGHLTPATVFGPLLQERLEKTGRFKWEIVVADHA